MKRNTRFTYLTALLLILIIALTLTSCGGNKTDDEEPEVAQYTVSFDSDGGSAVTPQSVTEGIPASAPASPTREGFVFVSWTLDGIDYDFTQPVTQDITLVARWTPIVTSYTVTFVIVDGEGTKNITREVSLNEGATAPDVPARPGYIFTGWDKSYDNITSDLTVNAIYEKVWTVEFRDYDNTLLSSNHDVRDGTAVESPADPARSDYTFTGWTLNGTPYVFTTPVTTNIILVASYEANAPTPPAPTTYTVAFDTLGYGTIPTQEIREGDTAVKPADPTRPDYTFTGWTLNGTPYVFTTPVTTNIILVASYEANAPTPPPAPTTYTVAFDTLGYGTIPTQEIREGDTAVKPADPTRPDYTFTGWTLNGTPYVFTTPVTTNIILVASYEANTPTPPPAPTTYTVTFTDENSNILKTEIVAVNGTYTPPAVPYKAHYAFTGWTISDGSVESGALTLCATYERVRHVVTFNPANGTGTTTPITVDDCAVVAAQSAPQYEGFTFLMWMTDDGELFDFNTRITKDITLTAKYKKNAAIPAATSGNVVINPGYLEFWQGLSLQMNIQYNGIYTISSTKAEARSVDVHYEGFTYTFYTDNTDVLTIAADGTITPVSQGTARVWAIIHQGGTQTYTADEYTTYDTFTIADGTVLAPVEVKIIDKPDYLKLYESDTANQQIQLGADGSIDINDYLSMPSGDYGSANIALWYNDTTAVMTITVDDNIVSDFEQWIAWSETYATPISIMAITREYEKYGNRWLDMTTQGNEVQPHGQSHYSSPFYKSGYLSSAQAWCDSYNSKQVIEAVNGTRVLALSYPCGYNADFNSLLYIGGRGVSYLPVKAENTDYSSVNVQSIPTEENFNALFDSSLTSSHFKYGGWFNILQHNIGGDKASYETLLPLAKDRIDSGELWAALFSAACQYGQERDTASITNMQAGADIITFTLTDKMNDMLFDHALTVKIKVDDTWTAARAYQNNGECETRIVSEGGETYVYVNAVPDKGEVKVIRSSVTNITENTNRIQFTPAGAAGADGEDVMTLCFTVDAAIWENVYAVQNGEILSAVVSTRGGVSTLTVTCRVNAGEVVMVPVTDQYDDRENLTMYEVWSGLVTPDGTKPVFISTPDDLVMFSDYIRNRGVNAGVTFCLTNDIDMSTVDDFLPIGWQTDPKSNGDTAAKAPFSGIFDGRTHTIYNLKVKNSYMQYIGLFGYTEKATITRLNVIGEMEGLGRVGGIVGRMVGGTMNGVTFTGSVTAIGRPGFSYTGSRVGGLVGQLDSAVMKNCAAYASVTAQATGRNGYVAPHTYGETDSGSYAGGIIGEIYYQHSVTSASVFDNIVFDGSVTAYTANDGTGGNYVGGFTGLSIQVTMTNVTIQATVTGNHNVGGVIGYLTHQNFLSSTYKNCSVTGSVTGNDYVAGFAGKIDANNSQKLYNSVSSVVVNAPSDAEHVGALYGDTPYGTQNTTSNYIYYIESLNPGMAPHPGTIKEPTKYCVAISDVTASVTALNTYATENSLPAWRLLDGQPSASYFPVFTVTILDKDGNIIEEQAVGNTLNVVLPDAPFYTGYEFTGWIGQTTGITSDGTCQMVYQKVNTYTVTFYNREGKVIVTQVINEGRGATAPTPTDYERYWFTGWDKAFDNITENLDVTAKYTDAYYVTFVYKRADGTETEVSVKTEKGTAALAPSIPAVDGYTFSGWNADFTNVTADITVTANYITVTSGPVTLNILQWKLTSDPSTAIFNALSENEIFIYTGAKDFSAVTLPSGWEVQCNKNSGQDTSIQYSAIIYNTAKYRFDSAAGIFKMSLASAATSAYVYAVPLLDVATNQQVVVTSLTFGNWAVTNAFGSWGKTEKSLKLFLADLTTQYSAAAGIVIGLRAQTKDEDTGALNAYTTCDDTTAFVTGYDMMGHYEMASDTGAEYVLTFIKDERQATIGTTVAIDPADNISTNPGVRYSITFDDAE